MAEAQTAAAPERPASPKKNSLDQTSVPQLLAEAWRDQRSGRLQLRHGKRERVIQVRNGSPIAIESNSADIGFASQLEASGLISAGDRLKIERLSRARECAEATAVMALQILDAHILYKAIREASRNRLCETFEWQAGEFLWSEPQTEVDSTAKPHDLLSLFQEELPKRWRSDRLLRALMPSSEYQGEISPRFRRVTEKLAEAGPHARRAIARIDGSVSVGQILGESAGNPLAAATLWTLLHCGILRRSEGRNDRGRFAEDLEFEFEITATPTSSQPSAVRSSAAVGDAISKANAKAEALRVEIQTLAGQRSTLDHYTALGVSANATPADLKRIYFKAAKKFHPDTLARLGLADIKEDAARVFARIAEAFETLSDPAKKAAYDAGGSNEPDIDTARLAQAETSFRKGDVLVRMGNFQGALAYLEPAVELWPDEPAYQSALGWALYKQPRTNAERAREHLEIAASLAPKDAVSLFRLGIVLRAIGDKAAADATIARAQNLDPLVEE